jgi:hypothetical protein
VPIMCMEAYLAGERDVRRGDLQDAGVVGHAPRRLHRRQALAPRHRLAVVRHGVHTRPNEQRRRRPGSRRRRAVRRRRGRLHHSASLLASSLLPLSHTTFFLFFFQTTSSAAEIERRY